MEVLLSEMVTEDRVTFRIRTETTEWPHALGFSQSLTVVFDRGAAFRVRRLRTTGP